MFTVSVEEHPDEVHWLSPTWRSMGCNSNGKVTHRYLHQCLPPVPVPESPSNFEVSMHCFSEIAYKAADSHLGPSDLLAWNFLKLDAFSGKFSFFLPSSLICFAFIDFYCNSPRKGNASQPEEPGIAVRCIIIMIMKVKQQTKQ